MARIVDARLAICDDGPTRGKKVRIPVLRATAIFFSWLASASKRCSSARRASSASACRRRIAAQSASSRSCAWRARARRRARSRAISSHCAARRRRRLRTSSSAAVTPTPRGNSHHTRAASHRVATDAGVVTTIIKHGAKLKNRNRKAREARAERRTEARHGSTAREEPRDGVASRRRRQHVCSRRSDRRAVSGLPSCVFHAAHLQTVVRQL